jgi:phosphatidate cytidylyltransferase
MNNLVKRILTGSVYVAALLFAVTNVMYIGVLFSLVAVLAVFEFKNICEKQHLEFDLYPSLIIGFLCYASILNAQITGYFILSIFLYFISQLFRQNRNTLQLLGGTLVTVVYIFVPLALIIPIGFHSGKYEFKLLVGLLILIWASDSWAYLAGRMFGKRKLFERHSPNKTWEGFWGSVLLTSVTGYVLAQTGFGLNTKEWMILGALTVFIATAGDLFQSMLKRASNLKDSGNILPGHGGILDRFDSILFGLPAFYLYFYYLSPLINS